MFVLQTAVIAITSLQAPPAAPQVLDASTERGAYAIYAALLPPLWERAAKGAMLLQQETEGPEPHTCGQFLPGLTGEWAEAANSFQRENTRVRLLQPAVPMGLAYRLVPRREILADDARLVIKHGRGWQRLPESLEYAAVSVVGFNAARTKALVYVRLRSSGDILRMELKDGKWIQAQGDDCGWIA